MSSSTAPVPTRIPFASAGSFNWDLPTADSILGSSIKFSEGNAQLESRDIVRVVVEYVSRNPDPFGAAKWKECFGVDVSPEIPLRGDFHRWWNGPDPVDVYNQVPDPRLVSETHFPPVFAPRFFADVLNRTVHVRSLRTLDQLDRFELFDGTPDWQIGGRKTGPASWVVLRKGVLGTRKTWAEQQEHIKKINRRTGSNYEDNPSVIDLATAILPYKAFWAEGYRVAYRCAEKISDQGWPQSVVLEGSDRGPLVLDDCPMTCVGGSLGVPALHKF